MKCVRHYAVTEDIQDFGKVVIAVLSAIQLRKRMQQSTAEDLVLYCAGQMGCNGDRIEFSPLDDSGRNFYVMAEHYGCLLYDEEDCTMGQTRNIADVKLHEQRGKCGKK